MSVFETLTYRFFFIQSISQTNIPIGLLAWRKGMNGLLSSLWLGKFWQRALWLVTINAPYSANVFEFVRVVSLRQWNVFESESVFEECYKCRNSVMKTSVGGSRVIVKANCRAALFILSKPDQSPGSDWSTASRSSRDNEWNLHANFPANFTRD